MVEFVCIFLTVYVYNHITLQLKKKMEQSFEAHSMTELTLDQRRYGEIGQKVYQCTEENSVISVEQNYYDTFGYKSPPCINEQTCNQLPNSAEDHTFNTFTEANGDGPMSTDSSDTTNDSETPTEYQIKKELQKKAQECYNKKRPLYFTQPEDKATNQNFEKELSRPKYSSYKSLKTRERSFDGFQSKCMKSAEDFATAGYFYKGFSDISSCFQCGFTHKNWQPEDDPMQVHIRLQPKCDFIRKHYQILQNNVEIAEITHRTNEMML